MSDFECKKCHQDAKLRDGCEPTDYCDLCAQEKVIELEERCAKAEAELFSLKASMQMCVGAAGIGDADELCGWIDQMRERLTKAEAACGEKDEALLASTLNPWDEKNSIDQQLRNYEALKRHALSSDCGKGWLSPEKVERLRAALFESQEALKAVIANSEHDHDKSCVLCQCHAAHKSVTETLEESQ